MTRTPGNLSNTPIHIAIKHAGGMWRVLVRYYGNTGLVERFTTWTEARDYAQKLTRRTSV